MFNSSDEDRSDLFLAGAVYILGPTVIGIILEQIPPQALAAVAPVLELVITLSTTVLVPGLLIRYRKERLRDFGFDDSWGLLGVGLVLALPVAAMYGLVGLLRGAPLGSAPLALVQTGSYVSLLLHLVAAVCVALLAVYATVKARTAFRGDPRYLPATVKDLGRIVAIAVGIATGLLLLTFVVRQADMRALLEVVAAPLGLAAAGFLLYRGLRESLLTARTTLLTPMVILAIGSLVIFGPALDFVVGVWRAAMLATIGLLVGALLESRRSAFAPLGLVLGLALLTPLVR